MKKCWRTMITGIKKIFINNTKTRKKAITVIIGIIVVVIAAYYGNKYHQKKNAIAIVNGDIITLEELKEKISTYPEFYQEYVKQVPQQALEDYISEKLLTQKAKKYERHYRKQIKKALENYKNDLIIKEFLQDQVLSKADISQEEINSYYNANLKDFFIPERIHLYEIVVPTIEAAETILKRLSDGEDFSEIAKRESISSSKENGGDLGMVTKGQLTPEIEEILFSMKPNQILGKTVKTEQGYHILKIGEIQPSHLQPLVEAAPTIKQILINQKKTQLLNDYLTQIKNDSKIIRFTDKLRQL